MPRWSDGPLSGRAQGGRHGGHGERLVAKIAVRDATAGVRGASLARLGWCTTSCAQISRAPRTARMLIALRREICNRSECGALSLLAALGPLTPIARSSAIVPSPIPTTINVASGTLESTRFLKGDVFQGGTAPESIVHAR